MTDMTSLSRKDFREGLSVNKWDPTRPGQTRFLCGIGMAVDIGHDYDIQWFALVICCIFAECSQGPPALPYVFYGFLNRIVVDFCL